MHLFRSLESCEHTLCLHTSTITRMIALALNIYLYCLPGYVYNIMYGIQCQLPSHSNAFTVSIREPWVTRTLQKLSDAIVMSLLPTFSSSVSFASFHYSHHVFLLGVQAVNSNSFWGKSRCSWTPRHLQVSSLQSVHLILRSWQFFVLLDLTDGLFKPIPHTFSNSCCYAILPKPAFTNFETVHTYQEGWWVEVLLYICIWEMSISHLDQNISSLDWGFWYFHHYHQKYAGIVTWLCPNCFLPNHFQFISYYPTIIHCYIFWVSDSAIQVKININRLYCHKYYILNLH